MLFSVIARFKPGVEAQRDALHEAFSDHLRQPLMHIRLAGAVRHADTGERQGVLLLIEADDRKLIDHFLDSSPYAAAGLYDRVYIDELVIEAGGLN
ncbi:MAG: YciI family protein [Caulobacteraceae bacterium]